MLRCQCATLCWHAESGGVTQIVYPFGPNGDPDDGVQYMRVQERRCALISCCTCFELEPCHPLPQLCVIALPLCRDPNARVHWWYWPDSYDSWIPADQAPETDEPDKVSRGALLALQLLIVALALNVRTCGPDSYWSFGCTKLPAAD